MEWTEREREDGKWRERERMGNGMERENRAINVDSNLRGSDEVWTSACGASIVGVDDSKTQCCCSLREHNPDGPQTKRSKAIAKRASLMHGDYQTSSEGTSLLWAA